MPLLKRSLGIVLPCALAGIAAAPAAGDYRLNDDLIIEGSLCVGVDCFANISFNSDTIILRENNLRILFDDTSTAANFPRNDWRLVANDAVNGGDSYFSIQDATDNRRVLTLEADAPQASLYVDEKGRVGLGTGQPATRLHVRSGDSPAIRLNQDGSAGFDPATWDLVGNEFNFLVRQISDGVRLPFRIQNGAPSNSLYLASDGDIGQGYNQPAASFHIWRRDALAQLRVETESENVSRRNMVQLINAGNPQILFENTANNQRWQISAGANLLFERPDAAGLARRPVTIEPDGDVRIRGEIFTVGGSCTNGCDAVFSAAYALPSIEAHAEAMWSSGHLPNVGPTIEGEAFSLTEKIGGMLNELETAHIYIEQLHGEIDRLRAEAAAREARLAAIEAAMER